MFRSVLVAMLLMLAAEPSRLAAHGNNPPYIAFWGPFAPEVARCQRQLGTSTQRCAQTMLQRAMQCPDPNGVIDCSTAATDAVKAAAMQRASADVEAVCSTPIVNDLLFRDLSEADTDMKLACDNEPQQMHTLMAPAQGVLSDECRRQLARGGRLFVRSAIRAKRAALDRIAAHALGPSQRIALINATARRVGRLRDLVSGRVQTACPDFNQQLGQSPQAWIVALELRANCVIYAGYIQSAYTCPR